MSESTRINDRRQLGELAARLGVRWSWHEPDEQGVSVVVRGDSFDNAGFWGRRPDGTLDTFGEGRQEIWIEIFQGTTPVAEVNLADVLAWAAEPRS